MSKGACNQIIMDYASFISPNRSTIFQPKFPFVIRHLFYRIAQGRAGHLGSMLLKEIAQQLHIHPLAYLAKHPSHRLVHKVVGMMQVHLGIAQAP